MRHLGGVHKIQSRTERVLRDRLAMELLSYPKTIVRCRREVNPRQVPRNEEKVRHDMGIEPGALAPTETTRPNIYPETPTSSLAFEAHTTPSMAGR